MKKTALGGVIALLLILGSAQSADAKIMIINHGPSIDKVSEVAPEVRSALLGEDNSGQPMFVGYKYQSFGLFWLDFWTWDGSFVLYDGANSYWGAEDEAIAQAAGVSDLSDLSKPWNYNFPPGILIFVAIVCGGGGYYIVKLRQRRRLEELAVQQPYATVLEQYGTDPNFSFEDGVNALVQQGVTRPEAEANWTALVGMLHVEEEAEPEHT